MSAKRTILRLASALLLFAVLSADGSAASVRDGSPFDALLRLDTPHYTGGLTRHDRAVARNIQRAMAARYTAVCPRPDPMAGDLIGFADGRGKPPPLPPNTDPELAALLQALGDPRQEVRDVAAYTIGLLGPAAKAVQPVLEAKFSAKDEMGGWYNFALGRVACENVAAADFRKTIPKDLLPPQASMSWKDYRKAAVAILAQLYLDRNIEYPPDMMGYAYDNYRFDGAEAPVPVLARILDDARLSGEKRFEAAEALARLEGEYLEPARPALVRALRSTDKATRFYAAQALVELHDEAAIPMLAAQIGYESWMGRWGDQLCGYGHAALIVQDKLIDVVTHSSWPSIVRRAVKTLGCIGSVKAVPVLIPLLSAPDWPLNVVAARALGAIRVADPDAQAALHRLAEQHWSLKVRTAASDALEMIATGRIAPKPADAKPADEQLVIIGGKPGPYYHGLPWCDETGRYSIDGKSWFFVKWLEASLEPMPAGFKAADVVQDVGTRTFLRVSDGWLSGFDGFEHEGTLAHVSDSGDVEILDGDATIDGIVQTGAGYFAYGYELLKTGGAGVLLQITAKPDGHWQAARVVMLPGPPYTHAVAPDGTLLLSDGPNDYAIVANQITPMKCEKTAPGLYFDKYPQSGWAGDD